MEQSKKPPVIGGPVCKAEIESRLLPSDAQTLTAYEKGVLWRLFQAIGLVWENLHSKAQDSSTLRSSWLEFVEAKTKHEPSYVGEYSNAVSVIEELWGIYTEEEAFRRLFLENGIPDGPPTTRIAHAKKYVVDEFIRVQVVASGFKSFGYRFQRGQNYKGYIGGSRFTSTPRVREYDHKGSKD